MAGPLSRHVMSKLVIGGEQAVGEGAFPFLAAKEMQVAGVPVRAIRISYTGELSDTLLWWTHTIVPILFVDQFE